LGADHPIPTVILAAGTSHRLGRPKQLLNLVGKPLIWHVAARALASQCDGVLVVVGHQAEAMHAALSDLPVEIVHNPDFGQGMSTSLHAGIAALPSAVDGVVLLLGDQPEVAPAAITAVIAARRATNAPVVVTQYGEQQSNPVLFGSETFTELEAIRGDVGGRNVVRAHRDLLVAVPAATDTPPEDVDTEEAYQALLSRWRD